MKLVYIANVRIPTEKAHGFQIMKMGEAFSKNPDTQVTLVAPKRFNDIREDPFRYYGIRPTFEIRKLGVLDLIPLSKILGPVANFIESVSFAFSCIFYLRRKEADIIYSRDQFTLWFLSFFNKKKFVFEVHSFPKRTGFYKRVWLASWRIITITHGLKGLIVKEFGLNPEISNRILVAPDGVDLSIFESVTKPRDELKMDLGLPKDSFLVGFVGRFRTLGMEKGIGTMIEALTLLDKNFKMVFVGGEDGEIKFYRSWAARKNVLTQCFFFGFQAYKRAVEFMKAMDVLVIPFPNKIHYAVYASPLKLFEYMASGRPIISSDLPALREILNDKNALFFKPENGGDLTGKIKLIASSQMLIYHLSQQALADVKEYTWQRRADRILNSIK